MEEEEVVVVVEAGVALWCGIEQKDMADRAADLWTGQCRKERREAWWLSAAMR
jgi:hypothetical protein